MIQYNYMKKLLLWLLPFILLGCNAKRNIKSQYPNGMVYEDYYESKRNPGQKEGVYKVFDDKGNLLEEAHYKKGLLNGKRILYYPNKQINVEENYVDGNFEGIYLEFFNNGNKKTEGQYLNCAMNGAWKYYYLNPPNKLKEMVTFSDNEENGPYELYMPSGVLSERGTYKNGFEEGKIEIFDTISGKLMREMVFKDSMIISINNIQIND